MFPILFSSHRFAPSNIWSETSFEETSFKTPLSAGFGQSCIWLIHNLFPAITTTCSNTTTVRQSALFMWCIKEAAQRTPENCISVASLDELPEDI